MGNVKAKAEEIWNTFETSRKKYSRSGDKNMYLAIIYKACKDKNCDRTFRELGSLTGADPKLIAKAYKRLGKNLQETTSAPSPSDSKPAYAGQTIPRIVEKLKLPGSISHQAKKITRKAAPFLEGKQPGTIGAACLLFHIRHSKIQGADSIKDKDVAAAAGIAASTLRTAYRTLEEHSDEISSPN